MPMRLAARLALPFAAFLAVIEVVRNWGAWSAWPFWLVDYIAVGLLLIGWWQVKQRHPRGDIRLAGAWGFTCAMFYLSFFSHLSQPGPRGGPIPPAVLTVGAGLLFAVTVVGFASAIAGTKE